jgi:hypothetical protein
MNKGTTLYWSTLKMWEECPQKFVWSKGWDRYDCGYGPGERKPKPEQRSRHHAVFGIVIQQAIEDMYNLELYRDPKTLTSRMLEIGQKEFDRQIDKPKNNISYSEARMTRAEMWELCADGITGFVQTMKAHRFLGPYAKAEVDLVGWIDKWNPIGGRADTIIKRSDTGVTIIDGKNTKYKMKYTDPDQLRWYALLYKLLYKELPDRLAYVWYRFPTGHVTTDKEGTEITETGVEWVEFDEGDLQGLAQRALEAKEGMETEQFDPTPSPKVCNFCDFLTVCDARREQKATNSAKRGKKSRLEEITNAVGGFADLSL